MKFVVFLPLGSACCVVGDALRLCLTYALQKAAAKVGCLVRSRFGCQSLVVVVAVARTSSLLSWAFSGMRALLRLPYIIT